MLECLIVYISSETLMKTYDKSFPETNMQNIENVTNRVLYLCQVRVFFFFFFFCFFVFLFFYKWSIQIKHNHTKSTKRFDDLHTHIGLYGNSPHENDT